MKKYAVSCINEKLIYDVSCALILSTILISYNAVADSLPDLIRTGGPSNQADSKIAVLVSQKSYADKSFKIIDANGQTVFNSTLQSIKAPEPWSYGAIANFSSLTTPGKYTVQVGGLKSNPWSVETDAHRDLVPYLLGLFHANRDGNELSSLHKPAHLNDATVSGGTYDGQHIDMLGGWMDAGDQLHFTSTTAYAAIILQLAAKIDSTHAAVLNDEADVGIRWLLKAHPYPDLFIGQVGGTEDHQTGLRDPAEDDESKLPGIANRFAYPSTLANIMGKASAALSLAAERNTGEARTKLLNHAQEWYQAGKTNPSSEPGLPGNYYNDRTWDDDLALAAVMLWRVTGTYQYLKEALDYFDPYGDDSTSLGAVRDLIVADLCGGLGHVPVPDIKVHQQTCDILHDFAETSIAIATNQNAPWGTPGEMIWGQTSRSGMRGALIAISKKMGVIDDATVAMQARDWLFGLNPWGASFVVGYGSNSPTTPHHWSSGMGLGLDGAVVGGPVRKNLAQNFEFPEADYELFSSDRFVYSKNVMNYLTNEPALDFNAHSILLLATLDALIER